jgi:cAMP-dependent protein kinase regulator
MADAEPRSMDRALAAWAANDLESGLRSALPLLEADRESALALIVSSFLAAKLGKSSAFGEGLRAGAERSIDTGNLPLAIAAAALSRELGLDAAAIYDSAAAAYARGSSRVKQKSPPALPQAEPELAALPQSLAGPALLARAEKAVRGSAEHLLTHPGAGGPLPAAPLFSSLDQASLRAFLEVFEIKLYPASTEVVAEGAIGSEAFVVARGELDVSRHTLGTSEPLHLARLGAGALVGEMALLSRAPRAATVTTTRATLLLVAKKSALDAAVNKSAELGREFVEHCRRRMLDNLVKSSAILRSVSPSERTDLVQRLLIRSFEPGERLVVQGQATDGLHLIASGEVAVVHEAAADDETVVARLGPGEVIGEVALVLRRPAIAEVVAHHPTVTLFLPRERFLETVRAHPRVFVDLYELAVRRDEETGRVAGLEAVELDDSILI